MNLLPWTTSVLFFTAKTILCGVSKEVRLMLIAYVFTSHSHMFIQIYFNDKDANDDFGLSK